MHSSVIIKAILNVLLGNPVRRQGGSCGQWVSISIHAPA
jgi:hypothetical protein